MKKRCALFAPIDGAAYTTVYNEPTWKNTEYNEETWSPTSLVKRVSSWVDVEFPEMTVEDFRKRELERIGKIEAERMQELLKLQLERTRLLTSDNPMGIEPPIAADAVVTAAPIDIPAQALAMHVDHNGDPDEDIPF